MCRATLLLISLFFFTATTGQRVALCSYVKILEGREKETLYYYEQNWKMYRIHAYRRRKISGFYILKSQSPSSQWDLVLVTEFKDSNQLNAAEFNFQKIIKKLRPNGPVLLNEVPAVSFRKNIFTDTVMILGGRRR